jgi:hypothetical protein
MYQDDECPNLRHLPLRRRLRLLRRLVLPVRKEPDLIHNSENISRMHTICNAESMKGYPGWTQGYCGSKAGTPRSS